MIWLDPMGVRFLQTIQAAHRADSLQVEGSWDGLEERSQITAIVKMWHFDDLTLRSGIGM